jgi:lipopolysaccharide cholinephosphotransferase
LNTLVLDNDNLAKAHQIQLEIAIEIRRICNKFEINYFLIAGTLLGAVRHKGFIPWDDDLDIGMLRKDYDRFIEIAQTELKDDYFLQTWNTDLGYGQPFAKIRKKRTKYVERNSRKVKCHTGIYIDIFPFDNVPGNTLSKFIHDYKTRLYRRVLLDACEYSLPRPTGLKAIAYNLVLSHFRKIGIDEVKKRYHREMTKYDKCKPKYVVAIGGAYGYKKESVKFSWLNELIDIEFENNIFKAPKYYHEYLKYFYGDYMTPPPIDKRYNRHQIIDIDFGEEK